jgi:hypothetical protein
MDFKPSSTFPLMMNFWSETEVEAKDNLLVEVRKCYLCDRIDQTNLVSVGIYFRGADLEPPSKHEYLRPIGCFLCKKLKSGRKHKETNKHIFHYLQDSRQQRQYKAISEATKEAIWLPAIFSIKDKLYRNNSNLALQKSQSAVTESSWSCKGKPVKVRM